MATPISTANLYAEIGRLGYTGAKMAAALSPPFSQADIGPLIAQSAALSHLAVTLYRRNPAALAQSAVDNALMHLRAAQSVFDVVSLCCDNTLNTSVVLQVANAAIAAIEAVWTDASPDQTAPCAAADEDSLGLSV